MVKLLVADDEQKICRLLESFFADRGYRVLLAHDGQAALACIREERPHLVFLDLHMPGLGGLDVLKEALLLDETIKIIVITAVEDEQTLKQVKALGAADYVMKPFSLEYLQEEVLSKVSTSLYEDLRSANQELKRASCVGCGMCAQVCPRGVLKLENKPDRFQGGTPIRVYAVDL